MIACICLGSIELLLFLSTIGLAGVSAAFTHFYNVWKCKHHHCHHNCGKK